MKRIVVIIFVLIFILFVPHCSAVEKEISDIYKEQYEASGLDNLSDSLPDNVKEYLDEYDFSDMDFSFREELTTENIFLQIRRILQDGFKKPMISGLSILAILLFGAAVGNLTTDQKIMKYSLTIGVTATAVLPVVSIITTCVSAIKSLSVFMLSFVPIYAGILVAGGKTTTSLGFSSVMLIASESIGWICSFIITPLTGMQLSLGICGSIVSEINVSSFIASFKKITMWIISLVSTILLGILGLQTAISLPADNLAARTAKFVIGSTVPVVGTTVSEAMTTVRACVKLLGSSAAIYAVIAIAFIFLPVLLEIVLWRVVLLLCISVSQMLSSTDTMLLLKNIDSCLSLCLGIIILIAIVFIISITIVTVF